MSQYYNIPRKAEWNYKGSQWKLSRSKIDLFIECPKCFYLDNKLGIKRPPGYPFNLNSAVDTLLKKEFDIHRAKNKVHPLLKSYNIDLVPFKHDMMDEWRENFKGIRVNHKKTGLIIFGAIDDIWVDKKGILYVVDYKSTSKEGKIEYHIRGKWKYISGYLDKVALKSQIQAILCIVMVLQIKKPLMLS